MSVIRSGLPPLRPDRVCAPRSDRNISGAGSYRILGLFRTGLARNPCQSKAENSMDLWGVVNFYSLECVEG